MMNIVFLILLNFLLILIIGFLTIDEKANINSRISSLILSFFISFTVVLKTPKMLKTNRLIKFGLSFIIYSFAVIIIAGFPHLFVSGLLISTLIFITVLYYGNEIKRILKF
jgi:hypothetical protein